MAHDIFGQRFYGNRTPAWHSIGTVSEVDQSAMEAMTAIGGGHIVEKYPSFVMIDGEYVPTGEFGIVRSPLPDDPQYRYFGSATDRYNVLSSLEVAEMFDEKVSRPCETLGFLGKGERMFLTWKLNDFQINETDNIQNYGFIATGFDSLMGTSLNVVTIRVVCANTWAAAISQAENSNERGKGRIFSGKHNSSNMKYVLGEWMNHVETRANKQASLAESFFNKLTTKPLNEEKEVYRLLFAAYPDPQPIDKEDYPASLVAKKEEEIEKQKETVERDRQGIYSLFNGAGTEITPDYYGLFNATTEWFNWGKMAKKPVEYSVVMGNRANAMNKMAEVLKYEVGK